MLSDALYNGLDSLRPQSELATEPCAFVVDKNREFADSRKRVDVPEMSGSSGASSSRAVEDSPRRPRTKFELRAAGTEGGGGGRRVVPALQKCATI